MMRPSRRLSLEAITAVDAIARHGSFSRAAAELNKVPSALSYTVTQLEQRLGVVLFDRSERRTRLTAAGSDFLADGRWLLEVAGDVERRLAQRLTGWEAEVRLAVDTPLRGTLGASARCELLSQSWERVAEEFERELAAVARRHDAARMVAPLPATLVHGKPDGVR